MAPNHRPRRLHVLLAERLGMARGFLAHFPRRHPQACGGQGQTAPPQLLAQQRLTARP